MYFKIETLVGAFILLALSLFVYMSFQLGSVRLNLARYATYTVSFNDVASLLPKADIKISGVKVGWVESIFLDPADMRVKVTIKVLKDYRLYKDSKVLVRQEGLLGVKYLELIPGTLEAGVIPAGGMLGYQEQSQRGLDELFTTVTTLAKQIERLGTSLEESTKEAREVLKEIQKRLSTIDRVFEGVEDTSAIFQETAAAVKQAGERVGELLKFDDVAVADAQSVVKKLTQGKGSLTKLLADDQLYADIKCTSDYARSCIEGVRSIGFGIDSHLEVLPHSGHRVYFDEKTNVKWYTDGYLASCSGVFGKLGLTYAVRAMQNMTLVCVMISSVYMVIGMVYV